MIHSRWKGALAVMALAACFPLALRQAAAGEQANPDVWEPVRFLAGTWEGTSEGQSGVGTVRRVYAFVLKDRYLHETNLSTYPPQAANKAGEVHEHWSLFSFDRRRKALVLRQFHQEGFVNQYVVDAAESQPGKLVFTSGGALITGGYGNGGGPRSSAWLYRP